MTLSTLPPPPYQAAMVDATGIMTDSWQKWFQQLYLRVGGISALSNLSLTNFSIKTLVNAYANSSDTTIYTSPLGQTTAIDTFTAKNNSSVDQTLSINLVPFGFSASASNLIVSNLKVPANSTVTIQQAKILAFGSGAFLSVKASADGTVFLSVSGRQVA